MSEAPRRIRRAARVLLFGPDDRLLLFRYTPEWTKAFWTAPGGECDPGEGFAEAARRELREETGIDAEPLALGYIREDDFETLQREPVRSLEHFFVAHTALADIDTGGHTDQERALMRGHRWFSANEVMTWPEAIFPDNILDLIAEAHKLRQGARLMTNPVIQTVTPITHDLGAFTVRRAIPSPTRKMVGPFIFVDQFGPARLEPGQAMDVRPHPHINLATVTWLFEGAIDHRDSLGSFATIRPGQVNLMTAGSGIVHSERSPAEERHPKDGKGGPSLYGMQTWLALPDGREEIDPAFESRTDLPLVDDGRASARVIMGTLWGAAAPTTQHAATIYAEIGLTGGASLPIEDEADERAVMLVGGDARIAGVPLALYELTVLAPGEQLTLSSAGGCRVMLMGGEAFTTPRHIWWNFVSSSSERLEQAALDWRAGKFPKVPGDELEFIPLPEGRPKIANYP